MFYFISSIQIFSFFFFGEKFFVKFKMTLKLITKNLKNKYSETLFKNEMNHSKEMDKQYSRIKLDFDRNSQIIELNSQVFLNRIRQKRSQWRKDDLKYREFYKMICRRTYDTYLEKNHIIDSSEKLNFNKTNTKLPPIVKSANLPKIVKTVRSQSETNFETVLKKEKTTLKLPDIHVTDDARSVNEQIKPFNPTSINQTQHSAHNKLQPIDECKPFENGRYSECDLEFLEKFPEKIELHSTEVGRQFLENKRKQHVLIKKQKERQAVIQANALKDSRFRYLQSVLV